MTRATSAEIRGKYAHIPTSSEKFAKSKHCERCNELEAILIELHEELRDLKIELHEIVGVLLHRIEDMKK